MTKQRWRIGATFAESGTVALISYGIAQHWPRWALVVAIILFGLGCYIDGRVEEWLS
jgi:hypothetical protein